MSGLFSYYAKRIPNFSKKAGPLLHCNASPSSNEAVIAFKTLKNDLCNASLSSVQDGVPFEVETDASDFALAAVLHKTAALMRLCHELSLLVKSGIPLSRRKPLLKLRQYISNCISLKDAILPLLLIRKLPRSCSRKRTVVKLKMLKFFRGVWN